ncbi:hypothetical protein BT93_L0367 [Corymbia citriodora subsp. variegata]|uniref:Phorbol-ester/DAG-type domain-containing protein n=1 Tax=Corymbia citriodora subsp. variegata TaxID=360336 RepID=A0A8T0CUP1_CORYI|nr:hypothetical protein BT93_L0367 [Corymbia citriodora subsp. variegata]KAF7849706.1 hypothetical protein BT93_L0367 [Corymbia citriodora subsp. variegata]
MERIEHFSHPHWLTKCVIKAYDEEVKCFACMKRCLNQFYSCNQCQFFLHEECANLHTELPAHPLHPVHPLTLAPTAYYIGSVYCHACDKRCFGFTFRCEQCDFDLDIDCALKSINPSVKDQFQHFSHDHTLVLEQVIAQEKEAWCQACNKRCSSNTYTCSLCKFFLHKSCAELKRELRHWQHKEHNLELCTSSVYEGRAWCNLCGRSVCGFVYHCEICRFDLDVECSLQSPPTLETRVQEQEIDHFSHKHPLTLREERQDDVVTCAACSDNCSSSQIYGCEECGYFLHESCAKLPLEMKHLDHEEHPLKLQVAVFSDCDICKKRIKGFTYSCEQCDFNLDIECARMPSIGPGMAKQVKDVKMKISGHDHVLTRSAKREEEGVVCSVCEKPCCGLIYVCEGCGFFLDEGCAKCQHFFHPLHELTLQHIDSEVCCSACEKKCRGFTFSCRECKFHLDVACALITENIHHFSHGHSLKPTKMELNCKCLACNQSFSDSSQIYGCEECNYFLHESCAKLPLERKHPYHGSHPLKLRVASYNYCDFCGERIQGFAYCCYQCDFNLDMKCVEMPSISSETMKKVEEMKIGNFAHHHELTGSMKSKGNIVFCSACKKKCTGLTYACDCKDCSFFLHKGCAELPKEYAHFFHPGHRLNLQNSDSKVFCGACKENFHGFTFSCKECKFHLDVACAMMAENLNHGEHIHHLCHGHPLRRTKREFKGQCLACYRSRSDFGEIYGCDHCDRWVHISCTELPQNVKHFRHDFRKCDGELTLEAKLALKDGQGKKCEACHCVCRGSVLYHCKLCNYAFDVECALMPTETPEGAQTKFFPAGHGHPLQLCSTKEDTKFRSCSVCDNPCFDPTYQCTKCEVFIVHKSCIELPQIIPKPSHHEHSMKLLKKSRFTCAACRKSSSGFIYDCNTCSSFSLHIGCMNVKPIINYSDHRHYLGFFENIHEKVSCRTCDRGILPCSSKETEMETENKQGLFRCVRCDYNLHLLCGPLPCLMESDNHKHVLQLEDKFIEDDSGKYYCDACEKKRDPEKCVYKCSQENCPYVAHFECMKPEVLRLLKGEQKEVELRTLGAKRIYGKVMIEVQDPTQIALKNEEQASDRSREQDIWTLDNLLDAFIQDEQTKLPGTFQILKKEMIGTGHASFWKRLQGSGGIAKVSPYSQQTFTQFMDWREPGKENLEFSTIFFENEELVEVERYTVIRSLAPILKQLLKKRGDISTDSELNLKSKSLIFNLLCGAISSMSTTQVNELSETLLRDWWSQVMMAKHAGFKIQFALDHLDEIFQAHFALRAEETQNHWLKELEDQIRACHLSSKNQAAKAEELTQMSRQYEEAAEASLKQELLEKAKAFQGKTAGSGLL